MKDSVFLLLFLAVVSILGISIYLILKTAVKSAASRIVRIGHDTASFVEHELYIIDHMEGHAFEYWCADLLKRHGYSRIRVTKGSGDQGVDILAAKAGQEYAIQCKRYENKLSNKPVQEIIAGKSFYDCDYAVVMTNSYFTDGAVALANKTGVKLWDRDAIKSMLSDCQNKKNPSSVESAQHRLIDEIELYSAATDDD
ncbi:MAG: restriction endonuclease [Oscillospiraceae bacterium]|nr:restriction endonuclease [Oscillospiraceae bacterium]